MNIRKYAFWLLDSLHGGRIRHYLKEVQSDMKIANASEERLEAILRYAMETIPYYKDISEPILSAFPVMNKNKYLASYDEFFSPDYKREQLYSYATSGSSGTPFRGYQDHEKRSKHTADLIFFHGKCGWELGDKYIFLRAWISEYKSSKLGNIKNNVIPYDVLKLDESMLESIVTCLKSKPIKMILGYGSALNQLADYLEKTNTFLNGLNVVISDSDPLKPESREILKERLRCSIVDRYSNEEHGLIAFSYDVGQPFEVNVSSYYVELLKIDSDEYAEPGEIGRIVITDLYNKAMPLIRYELGDLAISDDIKTKGVKTLRELQGRTADMLVMRNGVRISSASINNYMEGLVGIEKYQLVQNGLGEFELFVVEGTERYSDDDYKRALMPCIEKDSKLSIMRVDDIKVETTGKYKTFISKYKLD